MYNAIAGSCAEDEANAGGGGSPPQIPFTIDGYDYVTNYPNPILVTNCLNGGIINPNATDGTGNADRGRWIDFIQGATGTAKGESTFGTASSPTRTTQTAHIRTSQLASSYQNTPQGAFPIMVGGVITQGNMGSLSNIHWQTTSVNSSVSNGVVVVGNNFVSDADEHNANNQIEDDFILLITNGNGYQNCGIYDNSNPFGFNQTGLIMPYIVWGGGRGNPTFPAVNDTITFRITVDADISGTTHSVIHDFIIKFI